MGTVEIFVQSIDQIHIFLLDSKIKDIRITLNTVRMNRFWNYRNSLLCCPAQPDLCGSMCIFSTQNTHDIIIQISATCKRGISLYLDSSALAVIDQFFWVA